MSSSDEAARPRPKPAPAPWLEFVQRLERMVGEPVEAFVRSNTYFDLTTQAKRARDDMTRRFESMTEEWLHMLNLPAASDFRRLREQLSRLERQVNRMAKDISDLGEDDDALPLPAPATAAPAPAKPKPARAKPKPKPKARPAPTPPPPPPAEP